MFCALSIFDVKMNIAVRECYPVKRGFFTARVKKIL